MMWKHGHASRAINGRESRFTSEFRIWAGARREMAVVA